MSKSVALLLRKFAPIAQQHWVPARTVPRGSCVQGRSARSALVFTAALGVCAHMRESDSLRALRDQSLHDVPRSEAACIAADVGRAESPFGKLQYIVQYTGGMHPGMHSAMYPA